MNADGLCVQVCYYRDKQSINKFRIITATGAGVKLTEPFALETNWHYKVHSFFLLEHTFGRNPKTACWRTGHCGCEAMFHRHVPQPLQQHSWAGGRRRYLSSF